MTDKRKMLLAGIALTAAAGAYLWLRTRKHPFLPVASQVDLDRYLGEWHEIARLPVRFEKGCYGTKAIYAKRNDSNIDVLNICHKGSLTGKLEIARGKAFVADPETNAKLKVQFFWPFSGDYWILEVGNNYEYALVGNPDRKSLWILSRTPQMEKGKVSQLLQKAESLGFKTLKMIFTKQN
jgi:apolipoprotein D and lipocalin family protein